MPCRSAPLPEEEFLVISKTTNETVINAQCSLRCILLLTHLHERYNFASKLTNCLFLVPSSTLTPTCTPGPPTPIRPQTRIQIVRSLSNSPPFSIFELFELMVGKKEMEVLFELHDSSSKAAAGDAGVGMRSSSTKGVATTTTRWVASGHLGLDVASSLVAFAGDTWTRSGVRGGSKENRSTTPPFADAIMTIALRQNSRKRTGDGVLLLLESLLVRLLLPLLGHGLGRRRCCGRVKRRIRDWRSLSALHSQCTIRGECKAEAGNRSQNASRRKVSRHEQNARRRRPLPTPTAWCVMLGAMWPPYSPCERMPKKITAVTPMRPRVPTRVRMP